MHKKNKPAITSLLILLLVMSQCNTQRNEDDSLYSGEKFNENIRSTDARTPEEERAGFKLPPGFEITLFASEPDIDKPMNLAFDGKGRMWVTQSFEYPFPSSNTPKGTDRITILEDTDHDGKADKFTDVSDTVNIPIGVLPLNNEVVTFSIPNVYKYTDTDGDGKMDKEAKLYGPFGYQDTHGMVSNFMRGYDGWVHVCHGFTNRSTVAGTDGDSIRMVSGNTFRFKLDGSRVEQLTFGQVNPFGLVFDKWGYVYSTDSHSSPLYQLIRGGDYPHFGKMEIMAFVPDMKPLEQEATALAGISQYADNLFPAEFQENFFIGDVVNCRVHRYSWTLQGSSPVGKSEVDLVKSADPWFRPVNIKLGPDGALYIADFYNAIIGHYEVPLGHPKRDKSRGRIWRVTYKGKANKPVDLTTAALNDLVASLGSNNLPTRMASMDQLTDRIGAQAIPAIVAMLADSGTDPIKYANGLWVLYRLNALPDETLKKSLAHADPLVRVHALRILGELKPDPSYYPLVANALNDSNPHVQRTAVERMMGYPTIESVAAVLALQHKLPATDRHLMYTTQLCLRNLMRNNTLMKQATAIKWSDDDAASLAFVMVDVPSPQAAEFLAKYLGAHSIANEKLPIAYKHITRFIPISELNTVMSDAMSKYSSDIDLRSLVLSGLREGVAQRGGKEDPELFKPWGTEIAEGLAKKYPPGTPTKSDDEIARQATAVQLAGDYMISSLDATLKNYLQSPATNVDVRTSALGSLLKIDRKKNMALVGAILKDDAATADFRKRVVAVAGEFQGPQLNKELAGVKNAAPDLQIAIVMALSSSSAGKDIVFQQVRKGELAARTLKDPKVEERILLGVTPKQQKEFNTLTSNIDPIDHERQAMIDLRLKEFEKADQAAIVLDSGSAVFSRNCSVCHRRISQVGTGIGPQLHGIGKRGAVSLAEKILDPNRNISEAFRSYTIKLKDGKVLTGLFRREEGAVLVFADFAGKEFSVAKKNIKEQKASKFSVMPDTFGKSLTPDEFNALMKYLLNS